jgi:hypothetical protein
MKKHICSALFALLVSAAGLKAHAAGWVVIEEPTQNYQNIDGVCGTNEAVTRIACYGAYCRRAAIYCETPYVYGGSVASVSTVGQYWTSYTNQYSYLSAPYQAACAAGFVMTGYTNSSPLSQNIRVRCSQLVLPPGDRIADDMFAQWQSVHSTENNQWAYQSYFGNWKVNTGVRCSGMYCDEVEGLMRELYTPVQ